MLQGASFFLNLGNKAIATTSISQQGSRLFAFPPNAVIWFVTTTFKMCFKMF